MLSQNPHSKTVFIVEDRERIRESFARLLSLRGFRVIEASSVEEAQTLFAEAGIIPDVMLLDMRIANSRLTGADFGIEVKSKAVWPPEFLIHSGYDEVDYYQLAFKLGAATYLRKAEHTPTEVVRHVRALALRRALQSDRPGLSSRIQQIAKTSAHRVEALERFCVEILGHELASTLGNRFLLLLTIEGATRLVGNAGNLALAPADCEAIQRAVYGRIKPEPFVLGSLPLTAVEGQEQRSPAEISARLQGAAFIPLADLEAERIRLSLGILVGDGAEERFSEEARPLAEIIENYLHSRVVGHLIAITKVFAEMATERRVLLEATAASCTYLGQELATLGRGAETGEELRHEIQKVHIVGEELYDAGQLLQAITSPARPPVSPVALRELVEESWASLVPRLPEESRNLLQIEGQGNVQGQRVALSVAFSRTLQWLAQRRIETPAGMAPTVRVECRPDEKQIQVSFEDRSHRLPDRLRERLFDPFSQPVVEAAGDTVVRGRRLGLYLVRALVESEGASFEDRSDDLIGDIGHLFVMRFPAGPPSSATPGSELCSAA